MFYYICIFLMCFASYRIGTIIGELSLMEKIKPHLEEIERFARVVIDATQDLNDQLDDIEVEENDLE